MVVTKKVTKKLAPEVVAMIFWLKNRRPEEWRDRREVKVSGEIKTHSEPDFSHFTDQDFDDAERLTAKAHNGEAASRN